METITIRNTTRFQGLSSPTSVAVITLDGEHVEHRKMIERLVNGAREAGLKSVVLTFSPHMALQQDAAVKLLYTPEEQAPILAALGLDYWIIYPFTEELSQLSVASFIQDVLVNQLKAKKITIAYDHWLGRHADLHDLEVLVNTLNLDIEDIPSQEIDAAFSSSERIRTALLDGDIATANLYLNAPFPLTGTVVLGKKLGRQLGFPTANLHIAEAYKLIPQNGVYVVKGTLNGREYFGMMNIGFNPTVGGTERTIEIHFFDFEGNLYDTKIQVGVLHRLRKEYKFNSVEALQEQLKKDKDHSLQLIAT